MISKIVVLIAIFCFLSASTIASAHGGLWMAEDTDLTVKSSTYVKSSDSDDKGLNKKELFEGATSLPCHNKTGNSDSQANFGCELLCSVIGHVTLDLLEPFISTSLPKIETPKLFADLVTRQSIVEKRPPK